MLLAHAVLVLAQGYLPDLSRHSIRWDFGLILVLMAIFGAVSAFFSAAETALFSLQPPQLQRLREASPQSAACIDALYANPRRLLSMILLADTLANLPLCVLSLYFLLTISRPLAINEADEAFFHPPNLPLWPTALLLFVLIVGVCDLLPKVFALRRPERVAPAAAAVLHRLSPVLGPLVGALQAVGEWLAERLTPRRMRQPLRLTEAEFGALVEIGAEEGTLQAAESEMIQEIIKLGDKTSKDCMTPRVEAFAIEDDLPNAEAAARLRAERRHRVPVYGETPDDIVGILDARRFLTLLAAAEHDGCAPEQVAHYSELLDPPSFVSESMRAPDLLRAFLGRRQGMAVVVDEYGGTEGIVTLADLTEEIIGDVLPSGAEDLYIEPLDDDRLLAGGHARLDDLSKHPGFELQAEGLDTLSGLIFNRLGYLPKAGTVLRLPPGLKMTVRRVTRKTVTEVLIEKAAAGGDGAQAQPAAE